MFSVLSYVEGKAKAGEGDDLNFPPPEDLKRLGIRVRYQREIEAELEKIDIQNAKMIFRLFNTDRVPAWNLLDFVEIMLSLYQTTDSTMEDALWVSEPKSP